MATTFTIVAVFIPVAFMGGMVGQFFYEFGITVAAAVLVSLFVSFTLDPMLSSRWYDPDVEEHRHDGAWAGRCSAFNRWFDGLHGRYERTLDWSLRHRWVACSVAVVAFVSAVPDPRDAGRRFHARLQPRRVPDRLQGDAGGDAARNRRSRAGNGATAEELPDVEYTYTTIERRAPPSPVTEGDTYVKLAGLGQS